jgi:hypothetical protein
MKNIKKNIKVLILNPNIPPRAIKLFNNLSQSKIYDYNVFFYKVASKNRKWKINIKDLKFKYKILKSFEIGIGFRDYFPFIVSLNFLPSLIKLKPDVIIIPGWSDMPSYLSFIYCRLFGAKLVLRSESTKYEKSIR